MKICFVGAKYYYGDPRAGLSYEYLHLAGTLTDLGLPVLYLDSQQPNADEKLERAAKLVDIIICTPMEQELDWRRFGQLSNPKVFLFPDDEWRREYSLSLAPFADYIMSTAKDASEAFGDKYIAFQWGARLGLYKPQEAAIPISFVGQKYGYREQMIQFVEGLGLPVKSYGMGWDKQATDEQVIDVLTKSKISLTTSLSSRGNVPQIKARVFEIPAAGALSLAEFSPGINEYFVEGREAEFFRNPDELKDKVLYYLTHDTERRRIARAGQLRVQKDHDYRRRFIPLLRQLGVLTEET